MSALRKTVLRNLTSARRKKFTIDLRCLQAAKKSTAQDRKYVRIAGPTAYATRDDIIEFMERNGVDMSALVDAKSRRLEAIYRPFGGGGGKNDHSVSDVDLSESRAEAVVEPAGVDSDANEAPAQSLTFADAVSDGSNTTRDASSSREASSNDNSSLAVQEIPLLARSRSETFMNISTWYYEAKSQEDAKDIANKLRGKVCGMKLVRATPVDQRVVAEVPGFVMDRAKVRKLPAPFFPRSDLGLIMPSNEERDRCLLVTGLRQMTYPRTVWGFFRGYDVAHVRLLRKPGIASVVFREVSDMERAFRERSNMTVRGHPDLKVSYHC